MSNLVSKGMGSPPTLSVSTVSVALPAIPSDAKRAVVRVTGADIHMENDGSAALTTDLLVRAEEIIHLDDHRYNLVDFRFIRNASVNATLYISYFN
jgi:hypothetical protein